MQFDTLVKPKLKKPSGAEPASLKRRRSRTISYRELARDLRASRRRGETLRPDPIWVRPVTRADCRDGPRPCPWISCRYNLYLDVNPKTGSIKLNYPDKEVYELEETCALDIADRGGTTLDHIGELLDLTRERVRQMEQAGITRLRELCRETLAVGWVPE